MMNAAIERYQLPNGSKLPHCRLILTTDPKSDPAELKAFTGASQCREFCPSEN